MASDSFCCLAQLISHTALCPSWGHQKPPIFRGGGVDPGWEEHWSHQRRASGQDCMATIETGSLSHPLSSQSHTPVDFVYWPTSFSEPGNIRSSGRLTESFTSITDACHLPTEERPLKSCREGGEVVVTLRNTMQHSGNDGLCMTRGVERFWLRVSWDGFSTSSFTFPCPGASVSLSAICSLFLVIVMLCRIRSCRQQRSMAGVCTQLWGWC